MRTALPLALVRKFKGLEDTTIRRRVLRETLRGLDAGSLARYILHLIDNLDNPQYRALWLDMVIVLLDHDCLTEETREGVLSVANLGEAHPFSILLSEPMDLSRIVSHPDQEDLPLGIRKARARLNDREIIRRLICDTNPAVVSILIENEIVTENDVLHIASLRPQSAAVFRVLLESPRFGPREMVLAAMAQNPFCPLRIATAVLPLLTRKHLQDIVAATRLDPKLRRAAATLLEV